MVKFIRGKLAAPSRTAQNPVSTPPPSARVGDTLREARVAGNGDLTAIGSYLRIRPDFLKAIEDSDYKKLPGPVYALGFVRSYADFLGLDAAEMARRFKTETSAFEAKSDLSLPMAVPERGLPGGPLLLIGLIVAGCAYGVWYYLGSADRHRPERVAALPEDILPKPPVQAPSAEGENQPQTESPPAEPPPPEEPVMAPQAAAPPAEATPPAPASAPVMVQEAKTGHVFGATEGPARIVIQAQADSWIQVEDKDKHVISKRILRAGDTYRVPDQPGLKLRTGNAGGLKITIDGNPIPPIGGIGKFRVLALNPDKLGGKGR